MRGQTVHKKATEIQTDIETKINRNQYAIRQTGKQTHNLKRKIKIQTNKYAMVII